VIQTIAASIIGGNNEFRTSLEELNLALCKLSATACDMLTW